MNKHGWKIAMALYGTFLLWQHRLFAKPLTQREVDAVFETLPDHQSVSADDRAAIMRFLADDDGKPFYMINLMQYRDEAYYPDGSYPEVKTGRQADALYSRAVIRELLKRGSYPVFFATKLRNLFHAGEGTDFFETVGIVRYRSRRDMLNMIASPSFQSAEPHKWASLEKTVVVPSRMRILLDPGIMVPGVLLLASAIKRWFSSAAD